MSLEVQSAAKTQISSSNFQTSTKHEMMNAPNELTPTFRSFRISNFGFVCHLVLVIWCFESSPAIAQSVAPLDGRDGRNLLLENFRPKSMLVVEEHNLTRAKFAVVDVHTHFRHKFHGSAEELASWVKLMDRNK